MTEERHEATDRNGDDWGFNSLPDADRKHVLASISLAAKIYGAAQKHRTAHERRQGAERSGMVADRRGKDALTQMMDRAFRSRSAATTATQMTGLLRTYGIPRFFNWFERLGLWLFLHMGNRLPWLFVPVVKWVMRRKTAEVILPGERRAMIAHVRSRQAKGAGQNLNNLGEMILGEAEAEQKTRDDVDLLGTPDIECISVKASNLYSQVSALGHAHSVKMMAERLRPRLHAAMANRRRSYDQATAAPWDMGYKLVNLDMEAYADVAATVEAFRTVLDEDEFLGLQAGLAIQAYLPDSYGEVASLLGWARERVARGGAPIRIRVVKGANRAVELVDSSVRGPPCPVFEEKADSDASWKAVVELISRPENIAVCHLGIATHNIFDLCWAALLVKDRGVESWCRFEMLEGMVNHVNREVQAEIGEVLMYAPAVAKDKFLTAVAYLMRRFDEFTDPANFLSHVFGVEPGSPEWQRLARAFVESVRRMPTVAHERRRQQDRRSEVYDPDLSFLRSADEFRNEPDTDWTHQGNREWLRDIVLPKLSGSPRSGAAVVPLQCARADDGARPWADVFDRSRPQMLVAKVELADKDDIDPVLTTARQAARKWAALDLDERGLILARAVANYQASRADLVALGAANVGKAFDQTDAEVSEAIDFGRWYSYAVRYFRDLLPNVQMGPLGGGVIAVVPPWNFPVAIPSGGVFAALAAGNAVILKPSSQSLYVTAEIAECFWRAGVPADVLQVMTCRSDVAGRLVADPRVDGVIFTGGTDTADRILRGRHGVQLFAETGGKNATVVTDKADRELAAKHIADSFRNDGQKCSATSLVLALPEVHDDPGFWSQLRDAVASLQVGPAWDPSSVVTPLAGKPGDDLVRGLTTLEPGEEWVVEPQRVDGRDDFWSPGLKRGVRRGTFNHLTELFGPVIGVMRVESLEEAMAIIRETGYGLTFGIESLDDAEVQYCIDRAPAGVIYCNRNTVGAMVNRQQFGGWHGSRRGPGIQAGGLNYVTNFMSLTEPDGPEGDPRIDMPSAGEMFAAPNADECLAIAAAANHASAQGAAGDEGFRMTAVALRSQLDQWIHHFSREHRPAQKIRGEDNLHRYRPLGTVVVRVSSDDSLFEAVARIGGAVIAGNRVIVSGEPGAQALSEMFGHRLDAWILGAEWRSETDAELVRRIAAEKPACVRYARPERVPESVWRAAADSGVYVSARTVLRTARLELLNYVQEQTVARVYHRYGGNLRPEDEK
jgi:RHH-type proline utilization regulon transcriptional repressor/proline dehydrogenase/delta 1-pyrroline-5-carboxylate dehydrogenase